MAGLSAWATVLCVYVLPINDVADKLSIPLQARIPYGRDILKIDTTALDLSVGHSGKLIVVTAVNPTPSGEGKTTVSIGLADALNAEFAADNQPPVCALALREPSLGPVFGLKGSAIGGGASQIIPGDKISLHFTGDIHAITSAQNLLCALVDNHVFQHNAPELSQVLVKRCIDVNDRALRHAQVGSGGQGFEITAASEMMSIVTLAASLADLYQRVGQIVVGMTDIESVGDIRLDDATMLDVPPEVVHRKRPVTAGELGFTGAVASLLVDAMQPNLVQTLKGTPTFIHCGPFANVGPGVSSVIATKTALELADVVVTEGGFGADLGLEKFLEIKCREVGLSPNLVVLVATVRALKHHGHGDLTVGLQNVLHHAKTVTEQFSLPLIVAVNKFPDDAAADLDYVVTQLQAHGIQATLCDPFQAPNSRDDCQQLAQDVLAALAAQTNTTTFTPVYDLTDDLSTRITNVVQKVYGGAGVTFSPEAQRKLIELQDYELPICVAKSPISLSGRDLWRKPKASVSALAANSTNADSALVFDDDRWSLPITDLELCAGAGFIRVYTGTVLTMPGLGKVPSAMHIDMDPNTGIVSGIS